VIAECVPVILLQSLKILEIMAAIRLNQTTDQIEHVLFASLMDGNGAVPASGAPPDLLTSNAWEEVIVGVYEYHYIYIYPLKHTHVSIKVISDRNQM